MFTQSHTYLIICNNAIFQSEEQRLLKVQFHFVYYSKKLVALSYICRHRLPLKELISAITPESFYRILQNALPCLASPRRLKKKCAETKRQNVPACEGLILLRDAIESRAARLFPLLLVPHKEYAIFIVNATAIRLVSDSVKLLPLNIIALIATQKHLMKINEHI